MFELRSSYNKCSVLFLTLPFWFIIEFLDSVKGVFGGRKGKGETMWLCYIISKNKITFKKCLSLTCASLLKYVCSSCLLVQLDFVGCLYRAPVSFLFIYFFAKISLYMKLCLSWNSLCRATLELTSTSGVLALKACATTSNWAPTLR